MKFNETKFINNLIKKKYLTYIVKNYDSLVDNGDKIINDTENNIKNYLGKDGFVKLLNSGTSCIQLGLLALGVGKGDEVIIPANTYSADPIAVTNIGAIPIFCDINLDNFTIDIDDLKTKISSKTKVIMPTHIFGYPSDLDNILEISKKNNIKILEDCSHCFGGEINGQKLGTFGDIGIFSCYKNKVYGSFGNAGILFSKNLDYLKYINKLIEPNNNTIEVLKSLRTPCEISVNEAIVLDLKLEIIDDVINQNILNFKYYIENIQKYGLEKIIKTPKIDFKNINSINYFTILLNNRDKILYLLRKLNIEGKNYFKIELNNSKTFAKFKDLKLKNMQIFSSNKLSLPFFYGMKNEEIEKIILLIKKFLAK